MKKWTAPTVIAQVRVHAQEIYGSDVLETGSKAQAISLGEFVTDLLDAQLKAQMVQIAGQTVIVPDDQGNVTVGVVAESEDLGQSAEQVEKFE